MMIFPHTRAKKGILTVEYVKAKMTLKAFSCLLIMISITQFDNGQLTLLLRDFMPYSIVFNHVRMVKMREGVCTRKST